MYYLIKSKIMNINYKIVEGYCKIRKGRYLSIDTLRKIKNEQSLTFHLEFWHIISFDNDFIYIHRMNGASGETEQLISRIELSKINKIVYIPTGETFICFKRTKVKKTMLLKAVSFSLKQYDLHLNEWQLFLHKNGFKFFRRDFVINSKNMIGEWTNSPITPF